MSRTYGLLLTILFSPALAPAQDINKNLLQGTVYQYFPGDNAAGKQPVRMVAIRADYAQPTISDDKGYYQLNFDNVNGTVQVEVKKEGMEVINDNDLKLDLKLRRQLNIYLDKEGNTLKRQLEIEIASKKAMEKEKNASIAILEQKGANYEAFKQQIEKKTGKKFSTDSELRNYLEDRFEADVKNLSEISGDLVRQNLDNSNKTYRKILYYLQVGAIDSAMQLHDPDRSFKEIVQIQKQKAVAEQATTQLGDLRENLVKIVEENLADIDIALIKGDYDRVDKDYRNVIYVDSTNRHYLYKYATFLNDQHRQLAAIDTYEKVLALTGPNELAYRASVLMQMGGEQTEATKYQESLRSLREAISIYRGLARSMPDRYLKSLSQTLDQACEPLRRLGDFDQALGFLNESVGICNKLSLQDPVQYKMIMTGPLSSMGLILLQMDKYDSARICFETLVDLYEKDPQQNTEAHKENLALALDNLSLALNLLKNTPEAELRLAGALSIMRELALHNPEKYNPFLCKFTMAAASLAEHQKKYDTAENYFKKGIGMASLLAERSPTVYDFDLASGYLSLGTLYLRSARSEKAIPCLEKALSILQNLYQHQPEPYESYLSTNYSVLGIAYHQQNRPAEAERNYTESIRLLRSLVSRNPAVYTPSLVADLGTFASILSQEKKYSQARPLIVEAYELSKTLYNTNPPKYHQKEEDDLGHLSYIDKITERFVDAEKEYKEWITLLENDSFQLRDSTKKSIALVRTYQAEMYGNYSWNLLLKKEFALAEQKARAGLETDPSQEWIKINLAHALLLQGRSQEAEPLYIGLFDKIYTSSPKQTYPGAILQDLEELTKKGLIPEKVKKEADKIADLAKQKQKDSPPHP